MEIDDNTFMASYTHDSSSDDTNSEDDNRFIKLTFNSFAEQQWDDNGKPIPGKKVMSKKGAKKFAN